MKNSLLILLFLVGLSFQAFGQTPAKGFEGSWNGTLEAGGQKLRIVVTVTKSETGTYAGKFESVDQGATVPFDTVTLNGDNVRMEVKAAGIVYEAVLNKERTELTGKFTQGGQTIPLTSSAMSRRPQPRRRRRAPAPKPKPDYSAPADAPYTAEEVIVKTPMGHTLAGTLTLPKGANGAKPVAAIITISGSGPQDRDSNLGIRRISAISSDR